MEKKKMHRSTLPLLAGTIFGIGCIVCIASGYQLIAAIVGLVGVIASSLSFKEAGGTPSIYISTIVAIIFGCAVSPAGTYYMPVSMFFLAMVWNTRGLLFSRMGNSQFAFQELITYIIGLGVFVAGNFLEKANWLSWVFPGLAYLFGLFITFIFTLMNTNVAKRVKDFFGVKPGSVAPDFTLQDENGNNVSLSDYKGKSHVLVMFLRGDWCPTCHIMLRTYERNKEKFAAKNITLLAIGPDPVGVNKELLEHLGLNYKLLSDDKNLAAKAYGMTFMTVKAGLPDYHEGVPLPAAFLVDINGKIAYTTNPKKPGEIIKPDTIFPIVEKL